MTLLEVGAGALIGHEIEKHLDGPEQQGVIGFVKNALRAINHNLATIAKNTAPPANQSHDPVETTRVIPAYPQYYTINRRNRNHLLCFAATGFTVYADIPGVGVQVASNINNGWNTLDYPHGTTVNLVSGATAVTVLLVNTDEMKGNVI